MSTHGDAIRALRDETQTTCKDLAAYLGMPEAELARIERGERPPLSPRQCAEAAFFCRGCARDIGRLFEVVDSQLLGGERTIEVRLRRDMANTLMVDVQRLSSTAGSDR